MSPKSLYGQFILERENKHIIESDVGFISYTVNGDSIYADNIFVAQGHRHSGAARAMGEELLKIAQELGVHKLLGSVVPSAPGSTYSIMNLIKWGFRLDSSAQNFIVLLKEI